MDIFSKGGKFEFNVKKESKGDKHGSFAERLLAQNKSTNMNKMPTLLANNPPPPLQGDKMSKVPINPPQIHLRKGE